jgi:hypothetical protein
LVPPHPLAEEGFRDEAAAAGEEPARPSHGTGPGQICLSWILEAQCHPALCRWLQAEAGWTFDPRDLKQLQEAARQIEAEGDESLVGSTSSLIDQGRAARSGTCGPGLQYRLRTVPVCGTCLCIYNVVHSVVNLIRVQKKGQWAKREQQRRSQHEEQKQAHKEQAMIERCKARRSCLSEKKPGAAGEDTRVPAPGSQFRCSGSTAKHRSVLMDPETQEWLYGLDLEDPSVERPASRSSRTSEGEGDAAGSRQRPPHLESTRSSPKSDSGCTSRSSCRTLKPPEE